MKLVLTFVVLSLFPAVEWPGETLSNGDRKKIDGAWTVEKEELLGRAVSGAKGQVFRFRRDGSVDMYAPDGLKMRAGFRLDESTKPRRLVFTSVDAALERTVNNAIYKLEGDKLTICGQWSSQPGAGLPFPTKFGTDTGNRFLYQFVLKRAPAKK